MKAVDNVGVTFATNVLVIGQRNGVVNVTLGALLFSPSETKTDDGRLAVDPDPAVVARLRMDEACAKQLRDDLTKILDGIAAARALAVHANGGGVQPAEEGTAH